MKRFILSSVGDAIKKEYPEWESLKSHYDQYDTCIYETNGDIPIRLVAIDGGEPEDQTFHRDWSWVCVELNKIAEEKATC